MQIIAIILSVCLALTSASIGVGGLYNNYNLQLGGKLLGNYGYNVLNYGRGYGKGYGRRYGRRYGNRYYRRGYGYGRRGYANRKYIRCFVMFMTDKKTDSCGFLMANRNKYAFTIFKEFHKMF